MHTYYKNSELNMLYFVFVQKSQCNLSPKLDVVLRVIQYSHMFCAKGLELEFLCKISRTKLLQKNDHFLVIVKCKVQWSYILQ